MKTQLITQPVQLFQIIKVRHLMHTIIRCLVAVTPSCTRRSKQSAYTKLCVKSFLRCFTSRCVLCFCVYMHVTVVITAFSASVAVNGVINNKNNYYYLLQVS